jgi:histone deacetylase 1/2
MPPRPLHLPNVFIPVDAPDNAHHMRTHGKTGYFMPKQHFNLSISTVTSAIPLSYRTSLKEPRWHDAMSDEFDARIHNGTWSLVPCPAGVNVVTDKWIFQHKLHPDGSLARYIARWVLRAFTQQEGVDYGKTFSPVVKYYSACGSRHYRLSVLASS